MAYVKGVSAAVALDISDVILESDAKQVITAIQGDEFKLALVGGIVQGLKIGQDKILAARQLAQLMAGSARLDLARFNFFTS